MSPGQSRAFFGGFAVLAVAIAANMLMQAPRTAVIATAKAPAAQPSAPVKPSLPEAAPPTAKAHVATPVAAAPATPPAQPPIAAATPPPAKKPEAPKPELALATIGEPVRIGGRLLPDAAVVGQIPLPPVTDGNADTIRALQKELLQAGYGPLVVNGQVGPLTRAAIMSFEYDQSLPLTGEASERALKRLRNESARRTPDHDSRKIRSAEAEQVVLSVQHALLALGHSPGRIDGRIGEDTEKAIRGFESEAKLTPTGRVSAELFSQLARGIGARSSNR